MTKTFVGGLDDASAVRHGEEELVDSDLLDGAVWLYRVTHGDTPLRVREEHRPQTHCTVKSKSFACDGLPIDNLPNDM